MKIGKKMLTGSSFVMILGVLFVATVVVSAAVVVLSATRSNGLQPVGDYPVRLTLTSGQDYRNVYSNTDLNAWTDSSVTAGNSYGERFAAHYNGQSTPAYAIMVTVIKLGGGAQEIQTNDIAVGYYDVLYDVEEIVPTSNTKYDSVQFQTTGPNTMVGTFPVDTALDRDTIVWMELVPQVGGEEVYFIIEYKAVPA
jgi:hypothetical protein